MDCSTPGLPVPYHLLKFVQVHVHCISDAIQSSHPLISLCIVVRLSESLRPFFCSSYVYSCHFRISSASARSSQVSVLYHAHPCMKISLISSIFIKRSLVFPILLSSSICLHCSFKKDFLSPCYSLELCIQLGISFPFYFVFSFSSFLSYF